MSRNDVGHCILCSHLGLRADLSPLVALPRPPPPVAPLPPPCTRFVVRVHMCAYSCLLYLGLTWMLVMCVLHLTYTKQAPRNFIQPPNSNEHVLFWDVFSGIWLAIRVALCTLLSSRISPVATRRFAPPCTLQRRP